MNTLQVTELALTGPGGLLAPPWNFSVQGGEILTLMGPSGCGKSTLLAALAGHLDAAFACSGEVALDGRSVLELAAERRQIGLLFQDDLLFPHLNIWQNLAFALPQIRRKARRQQAMQVLEELGLTAHAEKLPPQLSGGQRARVSLMRALLAEPQAMLLDEPFSRLDRPLRADFRRFVFSRLMEAQIPTLMVTHDEEDIPPGGRVLHWRVPGEVSHV